MNRRSLDKIDFKILSVLQRDASQSAVEVGEEVGLSQAACWRRIQRLKDEGYITKIVALLDRHKLGLRAQLLVQVKIVKNDRANIAEFSEAIRAFPEVMECHVVLGMFDFLLRVVTNDLDAYQAFYVEKLSRVPHIMEVTSYVAASEIKSGGIPLARCRSDVGESLVGRGIAVLRPQPLRSVDASRRSVTVRTKHSGPRAR